MYGELEDVLDLSNEEARLYFLEAKSYCNLDLPEYFNFKPMLDQLSQLIGTKNWHDIEYNHGLPKDLQDSKKDPRKIEGVNYKLCHNKDGKYAWRPFEFIHPAMYVCLVNLITKGDNWQFIVNRIRKIQADYPEIECVSMPLVHDIAPTNTSETVLNWWNQIEQRSLELSLKYDYLLNTDITNCYGSIYTHSIVWALYDREVVKADVDRYFGVGNDIDRCIQAMSFRQTNGIPQGSVLMDFIAEMVLSYADKLLGETLKGKVTDYRILRYRDDYRFFSRRKEDAEYIGKLLSEVLGSLNFKINPQKTFLSDNIITDSIKKDKWFWIQAKHGSDTLQKQLLIIHALSNSYPNSGSLRRALCDFYLKIGHTEVIKDNVKVLIGVVVDIIRKNPSVYPISASIIGRLLQEIKEQDVLRECLNDIKEKFSKIPNTGYLFLWLQRISIKVNPNMIYDEPMCKLVMGLSAEIWNSSWLNSECRNVMDTVGIIDRDCLSSLPALVPPEIVTLNTDWMS